MARPQHISDDTIIEALATEGEVTAADLADRLGIGQSTAAKRLAALEGTGSVLRQPGGRVNGVRVADHWSVATVPSDDLADPGAPGRGHGWCRQPRQQRHQDRCNQARCPQVRRRAAWAGSARRAGAGLPGGPA